MTFKVLSTSASFGYYATEPLDYLKKHHCEVDLIPQGKRLSEKELIVKIKEYDAVIVGGEKITDAVIKAAEKLKVIAQHGAGIDNIAIASATRKKIVVINAPGANSGAVADLTIGLFLSMARKISFADRAVKEGKWPRVVGVQLAGKTLGIIGLGQIGKKVARRAAGFDMKVIAYDILRDDAYAQRFEITYLPLDELLAASDFVSIHIPLVASTQRLIGERELRLMKKEAFIVNISRGGIVNEEALYRALQEGRIQGAALDVFTAEPLGESPLRKMDNIILTPHMGGYTIDVLKETGMISARGIVDFLEGRRPQFVNNPEIFTQQ